MASQAFTGMQPANPRLQRTRSAPLRSPLSRKPLGLVPSTAPSFSEVP